LVQGGHQRLPVFGLGFNEFGWGHVGWVWMM
jgi:hypothetical protein